VWVTGDAAKSKEYLPRAQQSLDFKATALTCCTEGEAGPKGWTINADAHATIVVAHRGKVAMVFGYMSLNDTQVRTVLDALKKSDECEVTGIRLADAIPWRSCRQRP
jgi:predicted transcriptional regulator